MGLGCAVSGNGGGIAAAVFEVLFRWRQVVLGLVCRQVHGGRVLHEGEVLGEAQGHWHREWRAQPFRSVPVQEPSARIV